MCLWNELHRMLHFRKPGSFYTFLFWGKQNSRGFCEGLRAISANLPVWLLWVILAKSKNLWPGLNNSIIQHVPQKNTFHYLELTIRVLHWLHTWAYDRSIKNYNKLCVWYHCLILCLIPLFDPAASSLDVVFFSTGPGWSSAVCDRGLPTTANSLLWRCKDNVWSI